MATTEFDVSQLQRSTGARIFAVLGNAGAHVLGLWRAMRNRRSVAQLLEWDARMLSDIGLTRNDVVSAMSVRLREDPSRQLNAYSTERRLALRAAARERIAFASDNVAPFSRPAHRDKPLEI